MRSAVAKSAGRLLMTMITSGPLVATGGDAADAEALIRADLAMRCADGRIDLTDAGRAHLARLDLARSGGAIDPFMGQHLALGRDQIETAEGRTDRTVDAAESPLAWLARRKGRDGRALIEPAQLQAGERLRADFTRAQMMPRTTSNWTAAIAQNRRGGGASQSFTEAALTARQRVRQALASVGPEFTGLLLDVCCFLKGLEDIERERGWPPRSAKVVLQLGLDRLARYYGYGTVARGATHATIRTWITGDGVEEISPDVTPATRHAHPS
jgi:hypothetical protein